MRKIVLCGGGTGGHVFPNIAISELLKKQDCDLFYIGVNKKIKRSFVKKITLIFMDMIFQDFQEH